MKTFFGVLAFLFLACGGTTNGGDASTDATSEEGNVDAGPNLDGPYPCGTATCKSGEYCVHPCCGGAPPQCTPLPDSGTCTGDMVYQPNCFNPFQGPGCQPPPCKPPPLFCTPTTMCSTSSRDSLCACG